MTAINKNTILKGIIDALSEMIRVEQISHDNNFVSIYAERIPQGFKTPCFFVFELSVSENRLLGNYFESEHKIEVSYFVKEDSTQDNVEFRRIRELLFKYLDKIKVEARSGQKLPLRSTNTSCSSIDNELVFDATFTLRCERIDNQNNQFMQSLSHDEHVILEEN